MFSRDESCDLYPETKLNWCKLFAILKGIGASRLRGGASELGNLKS